MFQQNVYYIKNNIVLTQVRGCSLWSMIIKIMWLFNCYHKAMILLYWSSKEKTLFSAILFLLLQQVCKTKRSHEYWYLRNNNRSNQCTETKSHISQHDQKIKLIFALLLYNNIENWAPHLKKKWKFANITICWNLEKTDEVRHYFLWKI